MNSKMLTDLLKATKEGRLFDWLADNAWEITQDDLAIIAKETAYVLSCVTLGQTTPRQANRELANQLREWLA